MATEKQINEFARKIGLTLINAGTKMLRSAYDLKPLTFTASQINTFLQDQIAGLGISLYDEKYSTTDWNTWEWIKDLDLLDTLQYYSDTFDCDNFSYAFASRASTFYLLNSCGVATGWIYDPITKQKLFRHAFNLIITQDNGMLKLILYEPQTDEFKIWEKGKDNILPTLNWLYKPDWVIFF